VATTLSWVCDPAAEQVARDVLGRLERPAHGIPRHRRAASARLDLSRALVGQGKHDEASGTALHAVTSGYLVPSNYWRAREVITAMSARGVPEARELADAYRAETDAEITHLWVRVGPSGPHAHACATGNDLNQGRQARSPRSNTSSNCCKRL
jgi:hypothetical protein